MKIRSLLFAALGLALCPQVSRADDPDDDLANGPEAKAEHAVSIDDLLKVAVRLNPDLAKSRTDLNVAKGEEGGSHLDQAWVLTASGQWERNAIRDAVQVLPYTSVAEDKYSGQVGVAKKLPIGGQIEVDVGYSQTKTEYAVPDVMGQVDMNVPDEFVDAAQVTLTGKLELPLLRRFGTNIAQSGENKAALALTAATVKAQLAGEDLVKDIVSSYWDLAYAAYEVTIRQQALDLAKRQEDLTHNLSRAGTVAPGQIQAVEYELASREEALLHSQTDWEAKSLDLRRKAGLELSTREVVLRASEELKIGNEHWDIKQLVDHAKKSNRKLALVTLQRKVAQIDVEVAENNVLPDFAIVASGSLIGGDKFGGNALSSAAGADGFAVMLGAKFQWEISGAASANKDAAVAKRHKVDIDRVDQERQIETQIVAAVHQVESARKRVELSDTAIAVADSQNAAEHAAFTFNKTSNFTVMQKEQQLIDARLKRGKAISEYHIAVCQLQYLAGILLEQYGINARPSKGQTQKGG